ncbi:hypothetical protein [Methylobacterium soli]|uniref:Uncharacterized protein n=1 Tax=Methylobacterium soli TaxID=553447 RepID=A0A6L3T766_9HYPH|nr:hypothetical protein [Methylobacterium soli]KAB1079348.1 hypothetical protein F6X53_11100 [Methylobacterium soli]GJE41281.1 hypothetical protein AEGHOMDF_0443 [Methylobacterium soli]
MTRISSDLPDGVQRLLVWCSLGCALVRDGRGWRLDVPGGLPIARRPFPKPIQDRTAQAAIQRGARVFKPADLFGADDLARAA